MSTVRMCDRCGNLFSEREDGWTTMDATRNVRDNKTGMVRQLSERLDACARCSGNAEVPRPTVPELADPWAEQEREREALRRQGHQQSADEDVPPK